MVDIPEIFKHFLFKFLSYYNLKFPEQLTKCFPFSTTENKFCGVYYILLLLWWWLKMETGFHFKVTTNKRGKYVKQSHAKAKTSQQVMESEYRKITCDIKNETFIMKGENYPKLPSSKYSSQNGHSLYLQAFETLPL